MRQGGLTVRLHLDRREWLIGEPLGEGGFGQVCAAESAAGEPAAVKLIPKAPGAERELLFEDLAGARNVVPIIDRGETEDSWVLVMPRAEKSLRQHLKGAAGPLATVDVVAILSDIATALVDLDGRVVHRDLKPENVLLLDGRWCLADFGIARYAEATTAPDTRKYAWTKPYAAPEQWREERATSATDVYALGVIAYELLAGSRPFTGPDFRDQHLHNIPPSLPSIPATLDALVQECLYKAPAARPSPANLVARLVRIAQLEASSGGLAKLEGIYRAEVSRRGETARLESASRSEAERRDDLFQAATAGLIRISDLLREAITEHAETATVEQDRGEWTIRLNQATLRLVPPTRTPADPWEARPAPVFDVIAHASLTLTVDETRKLSTRYWWFDASDYNGRSHSLWFCDATEAGRYQWFETSFMVMPRPDKLIELGQIMAAGMEVRHGVLWPFSLDPGPVSAEALSAGMRFLVAWPFTVVSIGELDEFIDRWAGWLADAALGRLQHPSELPERPTQGSWRQS
jgi:eukaryotic-like serine/threonine-protein kinase